MTATYRNFEASHKMEPNWEQCLCHNNSVNDIRLIPFSIVSWETIKHAAFIRKESVYHSLNAHFKSGPNGVYHRQCYSSYTHKKSLLRFQSSVSVSAVDLPATSSQQRVSRTSVLPTDNKYCVICQGDKRINTGAREKLKSLSTIQASENLFSAATSVDDKRMLILLQNKDIKNLVAEELKYHKSCYRTYTKPKGPIPEKGSKYDKAFASVQDKIQVEVINNKRSLKMSELKHIFVTHLSNEKPGSEDYRMFHLKERIINCFKERVCFCQLSPTESEIVFSTEIKTVPILSNKHSIHTSSDDESAFDVSMHNDSKTDQNLFHAAQMIRSSILDLENAMSWPPKQADYIDCNIPNSLYNLLVWIIDGSNDEEFSTEQRVKTSSNTDRKVNSFCQDIIYATTKGRVKTPKHVMLSSTIKSLTGSSELVAIVNRFGHGISYSQVEELETAIALQMLED